ncbi:MAG: hypothetical protein H6672_16325, partial [Anaerolineaceae bacterium]|nr:hypothetical protein [Anaerolineaceae bacterium]
VLFPRFGLFSLMIADSSKHIVHSAISALLLWRRMQGFGQQRLLVTVGKTGLAAAVMGLVAYLSLPILAARLGSGGLLQELLLVGISGGLSLLVFFGLAALLRIQELRWLAGLLKQRILR